MQACSSILVAGADCLERIQRFAARLVKGFRRLQQLDLHSLNRRRPSGDIIEAYQVFLEDLIWTPGSFFYYAIGTGL